MATKEVLIYAPSLDRMDARLTQTVERGTIASNREAKGERHLQAVEMNRLRTVLARISVNGAVRWQDYAACQTSDPDLFFPVQEETRMSREQTKKAKKICETCPAIEHCYNESMKLNHQYGIWAGMTAAQRQAILDANKNVDKKEYRVKRIAAKALKR